MDAPQETQNLSPRAFITIGTSAGASVTNINAGNVIMGDHVGNNVHSGLGSIRLYPGFVVPDAGYQGSGARSRCLEGTREAAIRTVLDWKDGIDASAICWVGGPAGFGKSALAQTIAELCATDGILAASFFFLRGAGGRSEFSRLITTLAFQITLSVPETKPIIEKALQDDPTILHQSITNQLEKLIVQPLTVLVGRLPTPLVIIIDALDECNDHKAMHDFIGILASACSGRQLPVRFLLTSRGEDHIRQAFLGVVAAAVTTSLALETFDASGDIRTYLRSRFSDILRRNPRLLKGLPLPWPSPEDLDALEEKSDGLFIFASTLAEFVTDGKAPPDEKLKTVLNLHAGLDPLYEQVLRAVPEIVCFRAVLTTLMLVRKQPSIKMLADLLQLGIRDVLHALMAIQSIIRIPTDDITSIQLNHTSLRDFLVDQNRSNDLYIDPPTSHFTIAVNCVKLMNTTLQQDEFPTDAASRYAAEYWLLHLGDSRVPGEVSSGTLSILIDFSSSEVLSFVFNVMAELGSYGGSHDVLARYLVDYRQKKGNAAFLRVLQKINIQIERDMEDLEHYFKVCEFAITIKGDFQDRAAVVFAV